MIAATAATFTCEEAEPLLPLVADGALDADGDAKLFMHLASCQHCQDSLARHDLVALALTHGDPIAPRRGATLRLSLPWAVAAAASVAAVISLAALMAVQPATTPTAVADRGAQIIRLPVADDGRQRYLIVTGDKTMLIDPAAADGNAPAESGSIRPVQVGVHHD